MANISTTGIEYTISATDLSATGIGQAKNRLEEFEAKNKTIVDRIKTHWESFRTNWLVVSASITAAIYAISKAWDLAKISAEKEERAGLLDNLAQKYHMTAQSIVASMRDASEGLVTNSNLMKIALAGLAKGLTPDQMIKLSEAAHLLGKTVGKDATTALEELSEALETGRAKGLKNYLGVLDLEESFGKLASKMTEAQKAQAMYLLTLIQFEQLQGQVTKAVSETDDKMERLIVRMQNGKGAVGSFFREIIVWAFTAYEVVEKLAKSIWDMIPRGTAEADFLKAFPKPMPGSAQKGPGAPLGKSQAALDLEAQLEAMRKKLQLQADIEKAQKDSEKTITDIARLNEQIREQTAKAALTEREHIEWQAAEWRKAGADKIKIAEWTSAKLIELNEKERIARAQMEERADEQFRKMMSQEAEFSSSEKQRQVNAILAKEIEKYTKLQEIYQESNKAYAEIEDAKVKIHANAMAEINKIEYSQFQKSIEFEQKILQIQINATTSRLQFIGQEMAALDQQMQQKAQALEAEYRAIEKNPYANDDAKLEARRNFLESEYQLEQEYALKKAEVWWNNAQRYMDFAQQMSTMAIQYAMAEGDEKERIGNQIVATAIRFLAQSIQAYMFAKAKEHLINAASAAGYMTIRTTQAAAEMTIGGTMAAAWAAYFAAMSLNPLGGEAFVPAASAMSAAAIGFGAATAAVGAIGSASVAAELGMAALWAAGGIAVGAMGEAGASSIGGGSSASSYGGGYGGTESYPSTTGPVAPAKTAPVINIIVYGNIVDQDAFAREMVPSITKALEDGAH